MKHLSTAFHWKDRRLSSELQFCMDNISYVSIPQEIIRWDSVNTIAVRVYDGGYPEEFTISNQ